MKNVKTLLQLLFYIQQKIQKFENYSNSFIDALTICEFISKEKKNKILIYGNDYQINNDLLKKAKNIIKRIHKKEPLSYIVQHSEFYGEKFHINKNVFIPRSDTECLVEYIIKYSYKYYNNHKIIKILDLCCGSGCIGLTLKLNLNCDVLCVDISQKALRLAKYNSKMLKIYDNINFLNLNVLSQKIITNFKFDIIICNPPYINYNEKLEESVLNFEPKIALFANDSGLIFYKHIIKNYKKQLKNNGIMSFECGYLQANDIYNIFIENNYKNIKIIQDMSNNDRIVVANI